MRRVAVFLIVVASLALGVAGAAQSPSAPFGGPGVAHNGDKGLVMPQVVKEVKPQYTPEAMQAKIQGGVTVECIVKKDGTIGDVRVVKSLDKAHGLDQQAVNAAKEWRFKPGKKNGKAVPVAIALDFTFTLKRP